MPPLILFERPGKQNLNGFSLARNSCDPTMMRVLLLLLVCCLGTSLAHDGHSTALVDEVLDTDDESLSGRRLQDENLPKLKTRDIEAVNDENDDNADLYGFLATVDSLTSFTSGQSLACAATLIHADALLTATACKDYFSVGSTVQFLGGESGTIRHVSPISQSETINVNSSHGTFDLLVVFLESESLAPTAVWKQATQNSARVKGQGYASFTYNSDRSLTATGMELVSSSICHRAFSNDFSRSPNADVNNLVCASSGATVAVLGAPLLGEDNSLLGVAVSSSSSVTCESIRDCTPADQRLLWFASIDRVNMDNIERALCSSSRFPLDSCPPPLANPLSTKDVTKRNLAAPTSSRKQGVMSRMFTWLRNFFCGASPDQPPVVPTPVKPPTRAPIKPPTRAPIKPPTRAPVKPPTRTPAIKDPTQAPAIISPVKTPAKSPTPSPARVPSGAPVKPPTQTPVKSPTRAPAKAPTLSPARVPSRAPIKAPTQAPVKPPTRAPVKPPTRAPVKPPTRTPVKPSTRAPNAPPQPSEFPSFEPTSFTIPPTPLPVAPQKSPIPPPPPMAPKTPVFPVLPPLAFTPTVPILSPSGAPVAPRFTCLPSSPKCPGRNLMQKSCLTQCVAEENVRRKRKAGWRCGQCS